MIHFKRSFAADSFGGGVSHHVYWGQLSESRWFEKPAGSISSPAIALPACSAPAVN